MPPGLENGRGVPVLDDGGRLLGWFYVAEHFLQQASIPFPIRPDALTRLTDARWTTRRPRIMGAWVNLTVSCVVTPARAALVCADHGDPDVAVSMCASVVIPEERRLCLHAGPVERALLEDVVGFIPPRR